MCKRTCHEIQVTYSTVNSMAHQASWSPLNRCWRCESGRWRLVAALLPLLFRLAMNTIRRRRRRRRRWCGWCVIDTEMSATASGGLPQLTFEIVRLSLSPVEFLVVEPHAVTWRRPTCITRITCVRVHLTATASARQQLPQPPSHRMKLPVCSTWPAQPH